MWVCVSVCASVCEQLLPVPNQANHQLESIRINSAEEELLENQPCLSVKTQTEIRMNELGLPITLIIPTQYQRTDLSLLELSAAAGPGVDLRLRGRPGPRRAGLRDVSSFLQREEGGGRGGGVVRRGRLKMQSGQREKSGRSLYRLQVKLH